MTYQYNHKPDTLADTFDLLSCSKLTFYQGGDEHSSSIISTGASSTSHHPLDSLQVEDIFTGKHDLARS